MKKILAPPAEPSIPYLIWRFCMSATLMAGGLSTITFLVFMIYSVLKLEGGFIWLCSIVVCFVAIAGAVVEASKPLSGKMIERVGFISLMLIAGATATIWGYGGLYQENGISGIDGTPSLITAQYFSIVTFTTLGYGDLKPIDSLRLFAASQALLGYVYLGLIVGLFGGLISKSTENTAN